MENKFLNGLQDAANIGYTENHAIKHLTTKSDLLDMFAMGGAYRSRSDEDVILLFKKAYIENPVYALKCLFYLRDVRGGQGERRFFRTCVKWLANYDTEAMRRNLRYIPMFGRYDDLYVFVDTPLENDAFNFMKEQLALDVECKTPSLLAKWLKSENTSSTESRKLANITRQHFGMNHKQYRKTLSVLRNRINIVERLMSENRWDEIEFDKIPSKAGMIYKNAFARHDLEREKSAKEVQTYAEFARDTTKKVNAKTLYPYECVSKALEITGRTGGYRYGKEVPLDDTDRLMVNKYYENLEDYFKDKNFNALMVVDTSASMRGSTAAAPINVAISLGMYAAERAKGPFAGHYISFSRTPRLVAIEGVDFVDKIARIYDANLCENTNIEATFDMLLNVAVSNGCSQDDLPEYLCIVSDMEFDQGTGNWSYGYNRTTFNTKTLMESIRVKWANHGLRMPKIIYWNVDARHNNIPEDLGCGDISYVSGMSPSIFDTLMSGKSGYELMMAKLDSPRYKVIY